MSINYSDHLTAIYCPHCWSIPCRCSRFTLVLEWLARRIRHYLDTRYDHRQRQMGARKDF